MRMYMAITNRAERDYVPQPVFSGMIVFRGQGLYKTPFLGWGELANAGIEEYEIPCNIHDRLELLREPGVGLMAQHLSAFLERISQPREPNCVATEALQV